MKHTATPWDMFEKTKPYQRYVITRNDAPLLSVEQFDGDNSQANAEYIIRACNSHEELLGAARAAIKVLTMDSDMEEDFAPEIKAIKQAITHAEANHDE